tara:strand:+ start:127 stop:333 length:207 start_codon:yes stop_codon:yes gene_type:complete
MSDTSEQIKKTKRINEIDEHEMPNQEQNSQSVIEKIRAHDWNQVSDEDSSTSDRQTQNESKKQSTKQQ